MKVLRTVSIGLALSLAGTAAADGLREELERCAQLQNAAVRLACYDALASASVSSGAGSFAAEGSVSPDGSVAAAAEAPAGTRLPETGDRGAPETETGQSLADRIFGLLPGRDEGDNQLESRVVGEIRNPRQGTRFTLENGQVWQQVDRTRRNYRATNPRAEIKEGFMNSYRMRLEGLNGRIRVRRVK